MSSELKNILFSLYAALVYPVSGVLALVGIVLFLESGVINKIIGVVFVVVALLSMYLFANLNRRKSDKPANIFRIALGMVIIVTMYWAINSFIARPTV